VELNEVLVTVGGSLLALGLMSRVIKRLFLSAVLIALLVGVTIGPEGIGVIEPRVGEERKLMEELARITLAIALMATGLQVTRADLRENLRRYASLLTVGMVGMWVMTGFGAWLLLGLPFWAGFLLGAILTPTDPVVASALVTGPLAQENLPRRVRRTLQIESGGNDGLALPFVLLAAYMLTKPGGTPLAEWALDAGREIGVAVAVGLLAGYLAGRLTELSLRASEMEEPNLLGVGLALALMTVGLVHLLGGSGIFAVFVAALVFSGMLEESVREKVEETQETVTKFLVLPAFILFGTILPWSEWETLGLSGVAFVAWVLFLRRPPIVALALAPTDTDPRSVAFLAWFGPLGVAAIYYATYVERFAVADGEKIFAAATLAIFVSVLVHSITATPAVRMYAGRSPLRTLRRPLDPASETDP
jgi:NhaP-type Na+/H+ or K+/H+ antiporter